jgi:hypothetical protein
MQARLGTLQCTFLVNQASFKGRIGVGSGPWVEVGELLLELVETQDRFELLMHVVKEGGILGCLSMS